MYIIIKVCQAIAIILQENISFLSRIFTFLLLFTVSANAQTVFHTEDIENFYEAFDKVHASTDKNKQLSIVQNIYLDRGSLGLKYTIENSLDNNKKAASDN